MLRYNIALIPTENINQFYAYTNKIALLIPSGNYKMGTLPGQSFPHVTICQFFADSSDIQTVWMQSKNFLKGNIKLNFDSRRSKDYKAEPGWDDVRWVSLLCNKQFNILKEVHYKIADIVKPINAAFENYDPHMTLMNSIMDKKSCETIIDQFPIVNPSLEDKFVLALGESDQCGQLINILYRT